MIVGSGSGSERPQNMRIRWIQIRTRIRIRNTAIDLLTLTSKFFSGEMHVRHQQQEHHLRHDADQGPRHDQHHIRSRGTRPQVHGARIFKLLWCPGIDFQGINSASLCRTAGRYTTTLFVVLGIQGYKGWRNWKFKNSVSVHSSGSHLENYGAVVHIFTARELRSCSKRKSEIVLL